jgi:hypothetical protein
MYPDAPEVRPTDIEPVSNGRDGVVKTVEVWKAWFDKLTWEVRELVDPGRGRLAVRAERVGRGGHSGLTVRDTEYHVYQFEHGLLRRQWVLRSETAMLPLLEQGRPRRSKNRVSEAALMLVDRLTSVGDVIAPGVRGRGRPAGARC